MMKEIKMSDWLYVLFPVTSVGYKNVVGTLFWECWNNASFLDMIRTSLKVTETFLNAYF